MPMYSFYCYECDENKTKICKIDARDYQTCDNCNGPLMRKIDIPGSVWSPTRNSGHTV